MKPRLKLFLTGFLQVFLVACSTFAIARGHMAANILVSFGISYLWSGNVKRVAFGGETDKVIYALGAALGSGSGLFICQLL